MSKRGVGAPLGDGCFHAAAFPGKGDGETDGIFCLRSFFHQFQQVSGICEGISQLPVNLAGELFCLKGMWNGGGLGRERCNQKAVYSVHNPLE